MKFILEKCEGHICVKDKNGKEISKWSNAAIEELGGVDKIIGRAKMLYPNLEVSVVDENPAPTPVPPPPAPEPAPVPPPEPSPGN